VRFSQLTLPRIQADDYCTPPFNGAKAVPWYLVPRTSSSGTRRTTLKPGRFQTHTDHSHDDSATARWLEIGAQLLVFYSIGCYFVENELSQMGLITAGSGFWLWSERVIAIVFSIEYLVRWWLAPKRWRYPFGFLAIIDLLAILPLYLSLAIDLRSLRLTRTLRILRLFKLYRYNKALHYFANAFYRIKDELAVVGFVILIMVLFSSAAVYEFEHDAQPDRFRRLSDAIWWALVTLTSVGYGDIYPITFFGRIIAMFTMLVGLGIVGTFISLIGSSLLSTLREQQSIHAHVESTSSQVDLELETPSDDDQWNEAA
jgi:voltage-gated potassium channel